MEISVPQAAGGLAAALFLGWAVAFWGTRPDEPVGESLVAVKADVLVPAVPKEAAPSFIEFFEQISKAKVVDFDVIRSLYKRVAAASKDELLATLNELPTHCREFDAIVLSRLVETSPSEVLSQILGKPNGQRDDLLKSFYALWSRCNPSEATASLSQLADPSTRERAEDVLLRAIAPSDPDRALVLALEMGRKDDHALMTFLFTQMANVDPGVAARRAVALAPGEGRDGAISGLLSSWFNKDRKAALQWIESLPKRERIQSLSDLASRWASEHPEGLAAYVDGLPMKDVRELAPSLVEAWVRYVDPQWAIAWAESLPHDMRLDAMGSCYASWAKFDPDAAAKSVGQIRDRQMRKEAVDKLVASWVCTDPIATLAWLDCFPEGDESAAQGYSTLGREWAKEDPTKAVGILARLAGSPSERINLANAIVWHWGNQDAAAAFHWVRNLPFERDRDYLVSATLHVWSRQDLNGALAEVARMSPGRERSIAEESMVRLWAEKAAPTLADWLAKLPVEKMDDRRPLMRDVASKWLAADEQTALRWIQALPKGVLKDGAIEAILQQIGQADPALAWSWAISMTDAHTRSSYVRDIAILWLRRDAAAARATIARTSSISAEEKGRLLQTK